MWIRKIKIIEISELLIKALTFKDEKNRETIMGVYMLYTKKIKKNLGSFIKFKHLFTNFHT